MAAGNPFRPAPLPRIHSRYADGTPVFENSQPRRIGGPDPQCAGRAHSVIRWDAMNGRVYQLREFDAAGYPVRDSFGDGAVTEVQDGAVLPAQVNLGHDGMTTGS